MFCSQKIKLIPQKFLNFCFQKPLFYSTLMAESTKPRVLFALADGCEEIETIAPIDILRRAGADVTIASVMGKERGKV
jgi:hypothetical protein